MNKTNLKPINVSDQNIAACNDLGKYEIHCKTSATKREIHAALKLIELLYLQGEIPKHIYRNICGEYYGKGLDISADACYTFNTTRDAV